MPWRSECDLLLGVPFSDCGNYGRRAIWGGIVYEEDIALKVCF